MGSLQLSNAQVHDLAYDVVRRHAQGLAERTDHRLSQSDAARSAARPDLARLAALHDLLRDELLAHAGAAGPHLVIDLGHCAQALASAVQAGATYRETAAAGLMQAAAALGARWLADERLCLDDAAVACEAKPLPGDPGSLVAWAEAGWTDRFEAALRLNKAFLPKAQYALRRAVDSAFAGATLRSIADAVFAPERAAALRRFVEEERALVAAAGLGAARSGDQRVESLCIAADLVWGLGRFVRLAAAAAPAHNTTDRLHAHLLKAIHELAG